MKGGWRQNHTSCDSTPTKMALIEMTDSREEIRSLMHCGWEGRTVWPLWDGLAAPHRLNRVPMTQQFHSEVHTRRTENIRPRKNLDTNVHSSMVRNSRKEGRGK